MGQEPEPGTTPSQDEGISPLEDALDFIEEQDSTYTEDALRQALVDAGYPYAVVDEALRLHAEGRIPERATSAPESGQDLRARAFLGVIAIAVGAWCTCALFLAIADPENSGYNQIGLVILAAVMGLVALFVLVAVGVSASLRRGVARTMTTTLIVAGVLYLGLAGTCAMIMTGDG